MQTGERSADHEYRAWLRTAASARAPSRLGTAALIDDAARARAAASIVIYPQPIGFQAEYNVGVGPQLDPLEKVIKTKSLRGGYAMLMARLHDTPIGDFVPYVRVWNYEGGKKHETDAIGHSVKELEAGIEWLPCKALELTAAFDYGNRTNPKTFEQVTGHLVRVQAQFNY